jgi:NADPH:quinone reductase-like Zn-dependent oxidoreductase
MKGVVLHQYNKNIIRSLLSLRVEDRTISKINDDEVLIKIHAAPCNPSDIAFMQGGYNIVKTLPSVMGFEGSGVVVDAGKSSRNLIGKKVSCFVQQDKDGTWADFMPANKNDIYVLKDEMDLEQAACFAVNPFTAYGMFDIVLKDKSKALVLNAAGGQVPRFIRIMAKDNDIKTINIVRKKETVRMLLDEGVSNVLFESEDDFDVKLKTLCHDLMATVAFDAVGGELSGKIFNAMPDDSKLVVYGGLSNKDISGLNTMSIIFNKKKIHGFSLPDWKNEVENINSVSEYLQDKFINGDFKTKIQGLIQMEDVVKGLRNYISNMSMGKILIKP